VGSERLHRVIVRLTREGEGLHFDFTGSSPQVDAAVNCTFHATVAGAAVPIYTFICQGDIDWNDGVKRCLKVTAPAGTVVNATFPAPVSICTIGFRWLVTWRRRRRSPRSSMRRANSATACAHRGASRPTATTCSA
jgi:N-methylhydantoinase B/oxoprolinase/acetone carboxylase alpha subunit